MKTPKSFYIVSTPNENYYFNTKKEAIEDFNDGKKHIGKGVTIELLKAFNVNSLDIQDISTMFMTQWMATIEQLRKFTK